MNFKAVIFDLDGVIIHTDKYHYKAWKMVADELNIYFDKVINDLLRGVSRMESLDIILRNAKKLLTDKEKLEIAERKNKYYIDFLKNLNEQDLNNEVKETLTLLKNRGIKLAIGSSSKNAKFIIDKLNITDVFNVISDGNNISKSKPDPEVFLYAADNMNLAYEKCLIVEDAISGVEAAINGGFKVAAIGDATKSPLSHYKLKSIKDILNFI